MRVKFREAWSNVVARHSILRSSFHSSGLKDPVQVVHETIRIPWSMENWSGLDSEEQARRWQQLLQREREQELALDQAPLHRITLVRLAADRFKFLWSVPALLLDGWSWPLVFRDLSNSYHSLLQGNPPALAAARPYRDYISWIRREHENDTEQFWREKLRGMTQPTPLINELGEASTAKQRVNGQWSYTFGRGDYVEPDRLRAAASHHVQLVDSGRVEHRAIAVERMERRDIRRRLCRATR